MSDSVSDLCWNIQSYMGDSLGLWSSCRSITERMPFIRTLELSYDNPVPFDNPLSFLCSMLPRLETVKLPLYGATGTMLCGLSGLRQLREIQLSTHQTRISSYHNTEPLSRFDPARFHLPHDAFPALESLSFSSPTVPVASSFLSHRCFHRIPLTRLFIRVPLTVGFRSKDVKDFFTLLSRDMAWLEDLELWFVPSKSEIPARIKQMDRITVEDLGGVRGFTALKKLAFHHAFPLNASNEDFRSLAAGLPHVEVLILNPQPTILRTSAVSLECLPYFAEFCPALRELGVFVNGNMHLPYPSGHRFGSTVRFMRFGRSPLPTMAQFDARLSFTRHIAFYFCRSTAFTSMETSIPWDVEYYRWASSGALLTEVADSAVHVLCNRLKEIIAIARAVRDERERLESKVTTLQARLQELREP
ncbi:uncharacterized protein STEHIDRAFT_160748 [Stereum hirsutum FP-91666 SS1]|uniref:uncharacterized protein n=1 Tax=Stereum hirsutum (strain FP-91666) TaxID=721885 RepID=UPI0004449628|nr:uncharacterized protein STEHIDRAFT_160748 [Stereum hirsutum FP-91666 SS1]EIM83149.1 hypothetical protein STEHIDRAFT_160748 [Stereum hirsutum FP-91666 SS1]